MTTTYTTIISVADLQAALPNPDWAVVDCRFELAEPEQARQDYLAGHIPGAVFADIEQDLSAPRGSSGGRHPLPDPGFLSELFCRLGIDADTQVVAYDANGGGFAARLWWLLRYMGHKNVAILDGGWSAWQAAGGASAAGEEQRQRRTFVGTADDTMRVTVQAVNNAGLLVDSRDPARYRGEFEPLDPAAGHIPGARNRFWKDNLDLDNNFKPPATIAAELADLYSDTAPESVVFYCGSGVTACHNILAAVYAGLPQPLLYAGSWSEWCSDRARPVATGNEP